MIKIIHMANGDILLDGTENEGGLPVDGLMIHGYGSNTDEVLGLTLNLVHTLRVRILLFDLPGHGRENKNLLTLKSAREAVRQRVASLDNPIFAIGHSLGARLALMTGLPQVIIVSMPGPTVFEGNRRDLLETLRVRRVRESSPFAGLREILSADVTPAEATLLLRAKNDIKSCLDLEEQWKNRVNMVLSIPDSNHLDIVSHPATGLAIASWLKGGLS